MIDFIMWVKRFQVLSSAHRTLSYALPSAIVLLYLLVAALRYLPVHWFLGTTLALTGIAWGLLSIISVNCAINISIEGRGWRPQDEDD